MTKKDLQRKDIEKSIRNAWSSLESHLPYMYTLSKKETKYVGGKRFHIKAMREYAQIIKTLCDSL